MPFAISGVAGLTLKWQTKVDSGWKHVNVPDISCVTFQLSKNVTAHWQRVTIIK